MDGVIIPSYLSSAPVGLSKDNGFQTNITLRYGEVKVLLYPDNDKNQNGRFIEYYVDVTGKDGFGARTTIRYHTCQLVNIFGSAADLCRYTLRTGNPDQDTVGVGAKVLLLCIDGEQSRAFIIGGVRDSNASRDLPQGVDTNQGHNYFWEFNGAQQTVDKDGQLQFMFRGATTVYGALTKDADPNAEGSTILFTKTGGIKSSTPQEDQFVFLDHENKKLSILTDDFEGQTKNALTWTVQDDASFKTSAAFNVTATDNIVLRSAGVLTGAATDATMLGTTFRAAQKQLNDAINRACAQASGALNTASAQISAGSSQSTLPSAKPFFQAAAQALAQVATAMNTIASAAASFEGMASTYLSKVNLSD
jgi:hypothetical protein